MNILSGKTTNIVLITILLCVTAFGIYNSNWYIVVTNVCVISGVILDSKVSLLQTNSEDNAKSISILKKIVPTLYAIGVISLIIWGYTKYIN